MNWKTRLATSLLALMLADCVLDRQAKEAEPASHGPTLYGQVSVSVDHVRTR
jgi:hypothetical protein